MLASLASDDVTVSAPQLGKTIVAGLWLLIGAYNDAQARVNLPSWWTAPTYGMAEQGMEKLIVLARSIGVVKSSRSIPFPRLMLTNGGWIEARSWDNPESIYGPTVSRIAVDEFGYLTTEAHAALRSRVAETRTKGLGFIRYAGNVGEIGGEAEAIWTHAQSGAKGWSARCWTWRDRAASAVCLCGLNGDGMDIDLASKHVDRCERGQYLSFLTDAKRRMSGKHFRQLYGAEWVDWSTNPAYEFERAVHVTSDVHEEPSLPLDLSCDFNVDPIAWCIGQHNSRESWALDEIAVESGATTRAACREFLRRYPGSPWRTLNIYGDASGNSRGTKSTETDYAIIREMLTPTWPRLVMQVPAANPAVTDRINAVNAMLSPGEGAPKYYVHPRCEKLAKDLARVSFKPGTRDLDKTSDRSLTHFSDAEGYRIVREFPVIQPGAAVVSRLEQTFYHRPDSILGVRF